jgi:glucokinase
MAILGIDIGGTKLAMAIAGPDGGPHARLRHPIGLSGDWRRDLAHVIEDARQLAQEGEAAGLGPLERVGVSVPGPTDAEAGILINPPNLPGWENVPVGELFRERLGVEVLVENDANAAALAE